MKRQRRKNTAPERALRGALHRRGWTQRTIAEALGVTPGAVSQWLKRARGGGVGALCRRRARGPTPKLTAVQRQQVRALLARGVLEVAFGVRYHPAHGSRLVRACGWSVQLPVRRAALRLRRKPHLVRACIRHAGYRI